MVDPNSPDGTSDHLLTPDVIEGRIVYDTDWQDAVYRNSFSTDNNFSVNANLKGKVPFRGSLGFTNNGFLMVFAIVTYSIYIWFIHKYSTDFLMSIFLFMCLVFTFPLAAIKQCVAVAFCLLAVDKAINKK